MKKKDLFYVALFVAAIVAGPLVQKFCYRYPTAVEMQDYHEGHYSTEVTKMEILSEKDEILTFQAKHTNGSGFVEGYRVETGKAWVLPWETYWDSRKRLKGDK